MNDQPTPETDAVQHEGLLRTNPIPMQVVTANFARKLERERDEANEELHKQLVRYDQLFVEAEQIRIERDEAREALASREVVIAQQNVITDLILERDEAREVASELSDIASKHLSFLLAITPTKPNEKHEKETEKVIDALKRWKKL